MTGLSPEWLHERGVEDSAAIVRMVLAGIHREYPNQVSLPLNQDSDLAPPRELTPAFYGCFDWHSAVHAHWTLVRWLKRFPTAEWAEPAREALRASLTQANLDQELRFLTPAHRAAFERPYGVAWLLQLHAELVVWDDCDGRQWADRLKPLVMLSRNRLELWLNHLSNPIRTGEHSQTAFAMGLFLDWAQELADWQFRDLVAQRCLDFHAADYDAALRYEPSGHDFLSPILAAADLMRRVLPDDEFASWFDRYLPEAERDFEITLLPVEVTDREDGKLAHLDGLNLSRAWMLDGISQALHPGCRQFRVLTDSAMQHAVAGLSNTLHTQYTSAHWLGSFATYLLTQRGLPED